MPDAFTQCLCREQINTHSSSSWYYQKVNSWGPDEDQIGKETHDRQASNFCLHFFALLHSSVAFRSRSRYGKRHMTSKQKCIFCTLHSSFASLNLGAIAMERHKCFFSCIFSDFAQLPRIQGQHVWQKSHGLFYTFDFASAPQNLGAACMAGRTAFHNIGDKVKASHKSLLRMLLIIQEQETLGILIALSSLQHSSLEFRSRIRTAFHNIGDKVKASHKSTHFFLDALKCRIIRAAAHQ